eukprot:2845325-Prorocentrum_lima.AAC.1
MPDSRSCCPNWHWSPIGRWKSVYMSPSGSPSGSAKKSSFSARLVWPLSKSTTRPWQIPPSHRRMG